MSVAAVGRSFTPSRTRRSETASYEGSETASCEQRRGSRLATAGLLAVLCLAGGPLAAAERPDPPPIRDPRHFTEKYAYSWKALKERNVVMQQADYSCGAAALATLVRYYWGDNVDEKYFLEAILRTLTVAEFQDRVKNGLSIADLRKAAVAKGYQAMLGERTLAQLAELRAPVVLRIVQGEYQHFVVFRGVLNDRVFLADPIRGNIRMSFYEFAQQRKDNLVLVVAKPGAPLPTNAPLALQPHSPVQPELQAARRQVVLPPTAQVRPPVSLMWRAGP